MLDKLNHTLQRYIAILTPLSLVIGVILEQYGQKILFLVPWLFAFMTFSGSLNMNMRDVKIFKQYPHFILLSILFLHLLMPLWAYFLANLLLDDYMLTIGFVVFVAVPTGVTSMIWINICKGNMPLGLAIILIDTLLAPLIMPLVLFFVSGEKIELNMSSLIIDLLLMIVLPTVVAIMGNELTKGALPQRLSQPLAPFSKLCLFVVVAINSSSIAPYLKDINWQFAMVLLLVLLIAASGYFFAFIIGRYILKNYAQATAFLFTGGMRNIALGVVVATTYFPSKVAMPVVFGMLFQQVLASLFSRLLLKHKPEVTST